MSKRGIFQQFSVGSQMLVLLGLSLIIVVLFSVFSLFLSNLFFQVNVVETPQLLSAGTLLDNNSIHALKLMQIMQAIGLFILPGIIFVYLFSEKASSYLHLCLPSNRIFLLVAFLVMIVAQPAINWIGFLNNEMQLPSIFSEVEKWMRASEENAAHITKAFLIMPNSFELILNLFMIALLPAIGEELLFRGILQKLFTKLFKNVHVGIWVSAVLFSAMHMQFFSFVPRLLMGALFGYLLIWSNSLWMPILAHFVNNGLAVLLSFSIGKNWLPEQTDSIGAGSNATAPVIISLTLSLLCIYYFYTRKSTTQIINFT